MQRDELVDLNAFLTVADEGSFTRAAARLGTSQSALSYTIRRLETRLGVRLLTRTTRSLAPTEAGDRLLGTLRPALGSIGAQLGSLSALRERPAGTVRLTASQHAVDAVLWPVLERLLPAYPDVHVELSVDSGFADIVTQRFDAGVRLGEALARDMVAARVGPDLRMAIVGSPAYFQGRVAPRTPPELRSRCWSTPFVTRGDCHSSPDERHGCDKPEATSLVPRPAIGYEARMAAALTTWMSDAG